MSKQSYGKTKDMAVLDIASPFGMDATHYYGAIKYYDNDGRYCKTDIYQRLSISDAKALNKNHRRIYPGIYLQEKFRLERSPFREGQVYPGFDIREDLIQAAIKKYNELGLNQGLAIGRWESVEKREVILEK